MIAVFLAAFGIPVTFESVMWVVGSGSLANVASFTPGAVGVTQATNALALKTCCNVPNSVAVDYSTAQQLITTAWNQLVAIVLVLCGLRLDRRQAAGRRRLHGREGPGGRDEGGARKKKKLEKKEAKRRGEEAGAAEQSEE